MGALHSVLSASLVRGVDETSRDAACSDDENRWSVRALGLVHAKFWILELEEPALLIQAKAARRARLRECR